MAKEEKNNVGLFEVPKEGSPTPDAETAPEQEISTLETKPETKPDLDGLGLLDYEKTLAEQSNEASSSPDPTQTKSEEGQQDKETPMDAKEDPARFEYWQSKADRAASELNKFQDLQQKMHVYEPIINAIQKDDEILNLLESKINGKQTAPPAGQVQQAQVPENRPTRPDKPASYDPAESVNDPESQSWKYRESLEDYRDNMDEYREQLEQQRIAAVHQESEQQRQTMVVNHNNNTLKYEYGWEDGKIQKFNSDMQNPQSFNIHNLARYYNFIEGVDSKDVKIANTRAEEQNKQRQRAGKIPQTPAKAASQSNPTLSDADKFNLALLQNSTIRR